MKVRVLRGFVGRDGLTYLQGLTYDLPEARAATLVQNGRAEAVVSHKVKIAKKNTKTQKVAVNIKGRRGEKDGQ